MGQLLLVFVLLDIDPRLHLVSIWRSAEDKVCDFRDLTGEKKYDESPDLYLIIMVGCRNINAFFAITHIHKRHKPYLSA